MYNKYCLSITHIDLTTGVPVLFQQRRDVLGLEDRRHGQVHRRRALVSYLQPRELDGLVTLVSNEVHELGIATRDFFSIVIGR